MEGTREGFESLATRLYNAALEGNVPSLLELLELDPLILDRCSIDKLGRFPQSPLHIAANFGHLEFVTEILRRNPGLVEEVDHKQRSPLHVSSANGHLEIVKALVAVNRRMCLAWDQDGRNPMHVATMRGQIRVLDELLRVEPQAALELTNKGESVLHLCVKYKQTEALKDLVKAVDDVELLDFKDSLGNTVLHLAVATRQIEMIKVLLEEKKMEKNAVNANGYTAMDICERSGKDSSDEEIRDCLEGAKVLPGKAAKRVQERDNTWSSNQYDSLMVVASLIATMAFQAAMNPPGGVWQDVSSLENFTMDYHGEPRNFTIPTDPGKSIFGYRDKESYTVFTISNSIAFTSSVTVILLLISGFRYNRFFAVVLIIIMWISLSATTLACWEGSDFVTPNTHIPGEEGDVLVRIAYYHQMKWSLRAWAILLACLILGHGIRRIKNSKLGRSIIRKLPRLNPLRACACACPKTPHPPPAV